VYANEDPDRVIPVDVLRELEKEGKIKIVGANYDVETGVVTWL